MNEIIAAVVGALAGGITGFGTGRLGAWMDRRADVRWQITAVNDSIPSRFGITVLIVNAGTGTAHDVEVVRPERPAINGDLLGDVPARTFPPQHTARTVVPPRVDTITIRYAIREGGKPLTVTRPIYH